MGKSRYYVEALSRGLQILEAFSEESPSLSLTKIASSVGLEKSTAFRFVHTLDTLGYLERDPETKQYRLDSDRPRIPPGAGAGPGPYGDKDRA